MEISLTELRSLIREAVDKKLQEAGMFGIDWEKMKLLQAQGKLKGRWSLIMTAMAGAGGDPEKALALLKSAVATLELHKSHNPKPEQPTPSTEDMLDMSKL